MHASRFLNLVKNVTDLRPEELGAARELAGRYPYSQMLHLLVARGSRDQKGPDEQPALHRAAVYATDRTILKTMMTRAIQPRVEAFEEVPMVDAPPAPKPRQSAAPKPTTQEKAEKVEKSEPQVIPKTEVSTKPAAVTLEGDALRNDLKEELNRLHHLMSAFDATYEQLRKSGTTKGQPAKEQETQGEPTPAAPSSKGPRKPPVKHASTPPESTEAPLIEEIKTSKRKPKMVSPKVAEQGEIIDQFIKVAPTLPRTKPTEPTTDLSEDSVNYGDNIVSETLVDILLKQGKKAKAIEMLKKLIWKFPQKKAYFAAQIEALKS